MQAQIVDCLGRPTSGARKNVCFVLLELMFFPNYDAGSDRGPPWAARDQSPARCSAIETTMQAPIVGRLGRLAIAARKDVLDFCKNMFFADGPRSEMAGQLLLHPRVGGYLGTIRVAQPWPVARLYEQEKGHPVYTNLPPVHPKLC